MAEHQDHQDFEHDTPGRSKPVSLAFGLPVGIFLVAIIVLVITALLVLL